MKISILLPYKENFSPTYAGAVSLFVKDTTQISKFKKYITVFGNTDLKNIYNPNSNQQAQSQGVRQHNSYATCGRAIMLSNGNKREGRVNN